MKPKTLLIIFLLALATTGRASVQRKVAARHLCSENITSVYRNASSHIEIFNRDGGGFAVISGNRIIGYSDKGAFKLSDTPPAMAELLDNYRYTDETPLKPAENNYSPVAPLLGTIAWDQMHPYNIYCPTYVGSYRSATGCAATAMAQIMRLHKYPSQGRGNHSYKPEVYPNMGVLSVDFSQSVYDWDNMLESYAGNSTTTEQEAVGRLMYDAGVAISMQYGPQSGALSQDWPKALTEYFAYDLGIAIRFRANYDITDWNSVIYSELQSGRPVYATGFTAEGGHAFVFDGMDASGLIHVNWGWSGISNGYFDTTFLTPATQGTGGSNGGFNSRQLIITGIRPPVEGSEAFVAIVSEEGLTAPSSVSLDNSFTVRLNGKISNVGWQDSTVDFGLALTDSNEDTLQIYRGPSEITIVPGTPHRNLKFDNITLGNLTTGNYRLIPVAKNTGGSKWERVRDTDTTFPNYLNITVEDSNADISSPEAASLTATEFQLHGLLYSGLKGHITATVRNNGESEYYGVLTPVLLDPSTKRRISTADGSVIDIMPESSAEIELFPSFTMKPGIYLLSIMDNNYTLIAPVVETTVLESGEICIEAISAPDFGDNNAVDPFDITAEVYVGCTDGVFSGYLTLYFLSIDDEQELGCIGPEFVQLSSGDRAKAVFTGRLENFVPGEEYDACVVNAESNTFVTPRDKATTRIRIKDTESSIKAIDTDSITVPHFFNIQGIKLTTRPESGLYIEVNGTKATKKTAKQSYQ